jgi:hypothetical protein
MVVTTGTAITAANPRARTICLLFMPAIMDDGISSFSSSKRSLENCSRAYHINLLSMGVSMLRDNEAQACDTVVFPSQCCHTLAAV